MAFHQYNKTQYNASQYNADAFMWVSRPSESIAPADARIDTPMKVLADSISSADARIMSAVRTCAEFTFLADTLTKSVLNKGISETLRINDWLEIERKDQGNGNGWSN